MKYRFLIIIGFLGLVAYLAGFREPACTLKIITEEASHRLCVEIARTAEEKRVGLMGREELPEGAGMLFVYEDEKVIPVMWMKSMLIPLDMVFISEDLKISHIEKKVPPCTELFDARCPRYSPPIPVAYVLELPEGYTTRQGIQSGDRVVLPSGI